MAIRVTGLKKWILAAFIICMVFMASGCSYLSVALANNYSTTNNEIVRSCELWSGFSSAPIIIGEEDSKDITFIVNLKKGSVGFQVLDEEGKEVYSLEKSEEGMTTDTFTVEKSGTYGIKEIGTKFSGEYSIGLGGEKEE